MYIENDDPAAAASADSIITTLVGREPTERRVQKYWKIPSYTEIVLYFHQPNPPFQNTILYSIKQAIGPGWVDISSNDIVWNNTPNSEPPIRDLRWAEAELIERSTDQQ